MKASLRKKQVVVIGSSDETTGAVEARVIGRFIAEKGYILISGGRGGIMEAASMGASERGGTVVGILPGEDIEGSNRFCTIVIPTGIGYARNAINILSADLVVAIGGKAGTLSELAYARIYRKPVIYCDFAGGWSSALPGIVVNDHPGGPVMNVSNAEEACRMIGDFLG